MSRTGVRASIPIAAKILAQVGRPMRAREILERAGAVRRRHEGGHKRWTSGTLPTRSVMPESVLARDLAMDIKERGDRSTVVRVGRGLYALREAKSHG